MNGIFSNRKGQNTVEYLLILAVIVGVVLLVGGLLKNRLPGIADKVSGFISSATENLSRDGGN